SYPIAITVSMADQTFTLDGTTYSDVQYIFVQGFEGDDTITVRSVDGPGSIGASLSGDEGDDTLAINFDGGVWAGAGNDTLVLTDSYRGQAYGDGGNDRIFISGACVD